MTKTVDHFIASRLLHQPPMPADFSEVLAQGRERAWESGKAKRANEADQFWSAAPPGFFDKVFKRMNPPVEGEEHE